LKSRHIQRKQQGFTLVELMVALVLSLIVALAAISALLVSRQGFTSVDATSQLRDNARFATDFITRLVVQSGFKDVAFAASTKASNFNVAGANPNPAPNIFGFNDSILSTTAGSDPLTAGNSSRSATCTGADTVCNNGSDVLVLRYQSAANFTSSIPGGTDVDKVMFNCLGAAATLTPDSKEAQIVSILHVAKSTNGEPALMCKYQTADGAMWVDESQPLVEGVESFQVLYGTDGVVPNTAPVAGTNDSVPDRYLRADQLDVAGNLVATYANWRRVRSLRVGLVIRGAPNSAPDRNLTSPNQALYPFGKAFTTHSAAGGSVSADKQARFIQNPPEGDGRLRQTVTFTIYLHNAQDL
jgi:type IV pilus assembly protein PilW